MSVGQERKVFEDWAKTNYYLCELDLDFCDGEYVDKEVQGAFEAYQAGKSAIRSETTDSDLMLSAVIRMPFEMAMADSISRMQFYQRAQQALDELETLRGDYSAVNKSLDEMENIARWCQRRLVVGYHVYVDAMIDKVRKS